MSKIQDDNLSEAEKHLARHMKQFETGDRKKF